MSINLTLNNVGSLQDTTTAAATINANNAAITTALTDSLSLSGQTPNQMESSLDMNNNQIINLPSPATVNSPVRLTDINTLNGGGTISSLPAGGAVGDVLTKTGSSDYIFGWSSNPADNAAGLNIVLSGTNPVTIATTPTPAFTSLTIGSTSENFPSSGNIVGTTDAQTLTNKTISGSSNTLSNISSSSLSSTTGTGSVVLNTSPTLVTPVISSIVNTGTLTLPTSTDTLVGAATTNTFTNKTFNTAGTGNVFQINGTTISANTGSGSNVLATSPTLVTPTLGAAVATTLAFSPTTGGIIGTATNDNASAGNVGEYISSTISSGSAIAITTSTATNVTSISLTAGDWDVWGVVNFTGAASTVTNIFAGSINTTSAVMAAAPGPYYAFTMFGNTGINTFNPTCPLTPARFSLTSTTTLYLVAYIAFTTSTASAFGTIQARRRR